MNRIVRVEERSTDRVLNAIAVFVVLPAIATASAWAGPNENAKIVIHLRPSYYDFPCTSTTARPSCQGIRTSGSLYPDLYWAHLLVMDGDAAAGISSVSCGIDFGSDLSDGTGVDIFGWTICASQEFQTAGVNGPWPAPLSSNRIVWNSTTRCQRYEPGGPGTGVVAGAGYFYCGAYTPEDLKIIPRPDTMVGLVESCSAVVDTVEGGNITRSPSHLGYSRFSLSGTEPGYNPCGLSTPVAGITWSHIKRMYR